MKHNSIPVNAPIEIVEFDQINDQISKVKIKVCYVGDELNRNKSIITKDSARKLARTLRGSPIVGYYNEETGDFEAHEREMTYQNGKFKVVDVTKAYGFVDTHATVWFQKFNDEGTVHEYLCTEGYLWTNTYPEAQRVVDRGNNQSMELDDKKIDAHWTKDVNGKPQFFIINEAIMSKLCILGENAEPCFEGAQISKFSLDEGLKEKIFSLMTEMQEILSKGGISMPNENEALQNEEIEVIEFEEEPVVEEPVVEDAAPAVEEPVVEEAVPAEEEPVTEEPAEEPIAYDLEQIPEYVSLREQYSQLEQNYNALNDETATLKEQVNVLTAFKAQVDKKEKEAMIAKFDMLSDTDKLDVVTNIDKYSVEDIEAKLSVICVRNRVNLNRDEEEPIGSGTTAFSLEEPIAEDTVPAWVQLVREAQKKLN